MKSILFRLSPCVSIVLILLLALFIQPVSADTTVGGTISADTTWTLANSPYIVTSNITVQGTDGDDSITTLTIEPGVIVKFNSARCMTIGASSGNPGALIAQGTEADPVVFTSSQADPAPGDWYYIRFYNTTDDDTTVMEHCNVQYAGYGSRGQVYIYNAAPTLSNCTFSNSSNYDLYYYISGGGTVSNCTFNSGIYLLAASTADFTGNTFNFNSSYPIKAYADHVGDITYGNTFTNVDTTSYLEVSADTIEHDAVWTADIPYAITGNITVMGTDGDDEITTLTISPGATLKFNSSSYMTIGASSGNPGALIAQGTEANPIVFTSNQTDPSPGDWYYIRFYNTTDDDTTVMEHCNVQYAGYGSRGQVYIYNAAPTLSNCTFSNSSNYDLYYYISGGGTVSNCTFNSGIYLLAASTADFTGNTFNFNSSYPIKAYADHVGDITYGNTFTNVDTTSYLEVSADTIEHDAVWTADIPYAITGNITVIGTDGDDEITTLTISPGATLKFNSSSYMTIGASSGNPGALIAHGTEANPVVFTSNKADPAPGGWYYIRFYNTTDDDTSEMNNCVVEYGGAGYGSVYLYDAAPTIQNTIISNSATAGIYARGSGTAAATLNCNTFSANQNGIYWTVSPAPEMHNNNFMGNTNYGIYYTGSEILDAENNWWGDTDGPNTGGDATYGNVDADPWSESDNECGGSSENYPPYAPSNPTPADHAVRVETESRVALSWSCTDPNSSDTLTYDLYFGTASDSLQLESQGLADATYTMTGLSEGQTCYWQIIARDTGGLSATGPVWCFTTDGDPPDLTITGLTTTPVGGMAANSWVTLTATIFNSGSGPVVDSFETEFSAGGVVIGTVTTDQIIAPGASVQATKSWYYTGDDPNLDVIVDSGATVTETIETNNQLQTLLSTVADITAPSLTSLSPENGNQLQQIQQISFTLTDTQSAINAAAVMASFTIVDTDQQAVEGTISEANDTFTFVPDSLPLEDGTYNVSVSAIDDYGNLQAYTFSFNIDSVPPAKPVITGGVVSSGTIEAMPAENITDRIIAEIEGTREENTSLWINGELKVSIGTDPWSCRIGLNPGDNSIEVYSRDAAGNIGESEWVDIEFTGQFGVIYKYDASGRIRRIETLP